MHSQAQASSCSGDSTQEFDEKLTIGQRKATYLLYFYFSSPSSLHTQSSPGDSTFSGLAVCMCTLHPLIRLHGIFWYKATRDEHCWFCVSKKGSSDPLEQYPFTDECIQRILASGNIFSCPDPSLNTNAWRYPRDSAATKHSSNNPHSHKALLSDALWILDDN